VPSGVFCPVSLINLSKEIFGHLKKRSTRGRFLCRVFGNRQSIGGLRQRNPLLSKRMFASGAISYSFAAGNAPLRKDKWRQAKPCSLAFPTASYLVGFLHRGDLLSYQQQTFSGALFVCQ